MEELRIPAIHVYHADKWQMDNSDAATFTVTKETTTIDNGLASLKLDITVLNAATTCVIKQNVENFRAYRGKTLSCSVPIYSVTAGPKLQLSEGFTNFQSSEHTGSGWETLTVTGLIASNANTLTLYIGYIGNLVVSTVYIDSAMMTVSDEPIAYVPEDPQIEMERCQRYYQIGGDGSSTYTSLWTLGISDGTDYILGHSQRFHTPMAVTPTIVISVNAIREEGSLTNQKASYSTMITGTDINGFNVAFSKTIASNKPNTLIYSWTAVS